MHRLVRILLVLVLAMALPVQGFAAATMLHCGPGHHDVAQAAAHDHAHHHAPAPLAKAGSGKCSSCAACCIGAFLPAVMTVFATPLPARGVLAAAPAPRVGFFTDGPDRPPRRLFA